jgi:hypothetical protein
MNAAEDFLGTLMESGSNFGGAGNAFLVGWVDPILALVMDSDGDASLL